jgi:predicted DNA-binding transcriptional regulator AlpA
VQGVNIGMIRNLRMSEACEFLGLSESTVRNRFNEKSPYYDPRMPKPLRMGRGTGRVAIRFDFQRLQDYKDACREQA